jgi:hypothetical protein
MSEFRITQEELSRAQNVVDRSHLEDMEIKELFDDWVPAMEDVVKAVEDAYRTSLQLLNKDGNLQNEPQLNNLRQVLICMMAELQMVKNWRM